MTKTSDLKADSVAHDWAGTLLPLMLKGSLPGEREGFSRADQKVAAAFAAKALNLRKAGQVAIEMESFAAPSGQRLMRVALSNDNMPFLVDSVAAVIARHGLVITRLLHPVLAVERDRNGRLLQLGTGNSSESLIYLECERGDARTRVTVRQELKASLAAVRLAVADWKSLQDAMRLAAETASQHSKEFLLWAAEGAFTCLGVVHYDGDGKPSGALGIARLDSSSLLPNVARKAALSAFRSGEADLLIVKSNLVSAVHRQVPLDLLICPVRSAGKLTGISVHACLWTSGALAAAPAQVPILAGRLARLSAKYGFAPVSHAGKALAHAISELPHDIAVSISEVDLQRLSLTAMSIADRPRIEVELVRAPLGQHLYGFVWLPRDELTTARRTAIGDLLVSAAKGALLSWSIALGDGGAAQLRYAIDVGGSVHFPDQEALQAEIEVLVRGWTRSLEVSLTKLVESGQAARLALRFAGHFPQAYRDQTDLEEAAADTLCLGGLVGGQAGTARLFRRTGEAPASIRLKLYAHEPLPLSDTIPVLENFGFRVFDMIPTELGGDGLGHIQCFELGLPDAALARTLAEQPQPVEQALAQVLAGQAENDRFNSLMVSAGLDARAVLLFRALFRYMRQTGSSYGLLTVVDALHRYPAIARMLIALFETLHDPAQQASKAAADHHRAIDRALQSVTSIDDDRILRQMRAIITATLRTNMFAPSGSEALAFKFDSGQLPWLPAPVPWREIFVYAPRVEGIHLRAGPIARGGLRWSDRRDDFRTEILGLMKAQRVKNAVIVPTGAKGGFYPKRLPDPASREAWLAEGTESYRIFIRALLSVTDNLVKGKVVRPAGVICHDGDDPYFVVAADKGTATFSDIANAIALERGFWLGDAFASGGSVGYDHKAMGITARGGWVSVTRHFAEMGVDVQSDAVRAAGCGDMSGDVFGNGMLLSKSIRLVAAFDHRHIFLDPNPDPARSWKERARLFKLPRSSWADYDPKLISKGGGIFPRSAKAIKLSKQVQAVLATEAAELDPSALIAAILKAPVDLLWFGGIGTYIKARSESHAEVGDRTNEALRVNAEDLRCTVIGEGANLGVTQAARIAFDLKGGRINTDFIDNSAGVDCSDTEVNIKIALGSEVASGRIKMAARNRLLERMTDDVSALVLEDNRLQTLALSVAGRDGPRDVPAHIRIIETFEAAKQLDRAVEGIAANDELRRRAGEGKGLTRPELAVLLATAKLVLQDGIEKTGLSTDKATLPDLIAAFPTEMQRKHRPTIEAHPLRAEIIATKLANRIINRMGPVHPFELAEEEGVGPGRIAEAFVIAEQLYAVPALWAEIDTAEMGEAARLMLFEQVAIEMRAHMADILRNAVEKRSNDRAIAAYAPVIKQLSARRADLLPPEGKRQTEAYGARLMAAGAPKDITAKLVRLAQLDGAIGLAALAGRSGSDVVALTMAFTALGEVLGIDWAQGIAMQLDPEDPWERLLAAGIARDFQTMRLDFLGRAGGKNPRESVQKWAEANAERIAPFTAVIARARTGNMPSPAMLAQIAGQARVVLSRA